jgi:hypothetical protein
MSALILTLITGLILVAVLVIAARGSTSSIHSIEQVTALSRPVDLESFRNLISVSEEEFLRNSLAARQFRQVQRQRMIAALDYVSRAAHNSAILLRLGEAGRKSDNPQLVKAGDELANSALQMRLLCLSVMAILILRIALPQLRITIAAVCDRYASTRDRVLTFGRVEQTVFASQIDSAL